MGDRPGRYQWHVVCHRFEKQRNQVCRVRQKPKKRTALAYYIKAHKGQEKMDKERRGREKSHLKEFCSISHW